MNRASTSDPGGPDPHKDAGPPRTPNTDMQADDTGTTDSGSGQLPDAHGDTATEPGKPNPQADTGRPR